MISLLSFRRLWLEATIAPLAQAQRFLEFLHDLGERPAHPMRFQGGECTRH